MSHTFEGKSIDPLRSEVCKTCKYRTMLHTSITLVVAFMSELADLRRVCFWTTKKSAAGLGVL